MVCVYIILEIVYTTDLGQYILLYMNASNRKRDNGVNT